MGGVNAVDLDDVLAIFHEPFLKFLHENTGIELKPCEVTRYDMWNLIGMTEDRMHYWFEKFYITDEFRNLPTVAGSIEGVGRFNSSRLVGITSRPKSTKNATLDWLTAYFGGRLSDVYFSSDWANKDNGGKKADICRHLGVRVMVEDSLEYARSCSPVVARVYLLDYPWNRAENLPRNVERIKNWDYFIGMK